MKSGKRLTSVQGDRKLISDSPKGRKKSSSTLAAALSEKIAKSVSALEAGLNVCKSDQVFRTYRY